MELDIIRYIILHIDKKAIQRNCKKILKKLSYKSVKDTGNITELILRLYIYGYKNEALQVCALFDNIEFAGNYTIWNNIDAAYCIKARILREKGETSSASKIINFLNQYRFPHLYANGKEWFTKTLDVNIQSNLNDKRKADARAWRLVKFECAICYREVGGYPYSDEYLEDIIVDMINILSKEK
ncbi:DUF6707 family protein [Terrisporobacter mayombei]|uniref:Uncharacterized protein n=1 Tax=Terrisporobacter mayombei TaxID=1541 RepID=A0ABY9PX17_9FIRM|nr:DUF6707 family protein [Terrisporobacter mayombei]MCC3868074.1 hypothetical protein [Terrisporobacter mayombei]WMT80212.1 hypothetical protein TEMA_05250 [Terrisporobacter mayombei]